MKPSKNNILNNNAKPASANVKTTLEPALNPNPAANENIPERSESREEQNREKTKGVGSEITDGEDA